MSGFGVQEFGIGPFNGSAFGIGPFGVSGSVASGGIDTYTKLMLHCDGTNGSTTFIDSSLVPHTMTANGTTVIDTSQSVFGTASAKIGGGTGQFIRTPNSTDFDFGGGDFTIDFRIRYSSLNALLEGWVNKWVGANRGFEFYRLATGNTIGFDYSTTGANTLSITSSATWTPTLNTWYHVAVVRNTTNIMFFIDGVKLGVNQNIGTDVIFAPTAILEVGDIDSAFSVDAWMDEVRISKGIARWTSNFTPPTSAYTT